MAANNDSNTPDRRPLYSQVKSLMIEYMTSGNWRPGQMLPSEMALASEFGVSQGTVRKALHELEAQNLIFRRQGRGTFVTEHTPQHSLFHFFRIKDDRGAFELPTSVVVDLRSRRATKAQEKLLRLESREMVESLMRTRHLRGKPIILERIHLPARLFPGLSLPVGEEMAQELYVLYQQRFGVTIVRAHDMLKAVLADSTDARHLDVSEGSPIMEITRVAYDLADNPVELRISRCNTRNHHYATDLD